MPRPGTALVHPDLLASLEQVGWYDQTITIESDEGTANAYGEIVAGWAQVSGLVDLDCRIAPSTATRSGGEQRRRDGTYVDASHTIALTGHHPTIVEHMRAVTSDDTIHDIVLVTHDAEDASTYLHTRVLDDGSR